MTDLSKTIAPKSKQLNADDLTMGPITIRVSCVSAMSGDQPIAINFEGDGGKPYMPCKSMRRVLIKAWGSDGKTYAGRSMTLYRDDSVMFGGLEVGGIRISHMSHIERDITMALTATQKSRKPFTVRRLVAPDTNPVVTVEVLDAGLAAAQGGVSAYSSWKDSLPPEVKQSIKTLHANWAHIAKESDKARTVQDNLDKPQTEGCSDV